MRKKFITFFINFSIFWIFLDLLPNISFPSSYAGRLYVSLGYAFVINFVPFILGFFRFPKIPALIGAVGIAIVFAYLYILDSYFSSLLQFFPTVIGDADLIFFKLPLIMVLEDKNSIFLFSSTLLVICSIILGKQIK